MGAQLVPLDKAPQWILRTTEKKMPTVAREVKRGVLEAVYQDPLVTEQRRLTGTLRASTIPYGGEFVGRDLEYGPGHQPLPEAEIDQVIAALQPGDTVGVAEDAEHDGYPYGLKIEWRFKLFERTAASIRGKLPAIITKAIGRTIFGRRR